MDGWRVLVVQRPSWSCQISADGDTERLQIYPTTRTHFEVGEQDAWDWDARQQWGRTWYRDPSTGDAKIAWDGALEFVGRLLRDI